MQAFETPAAAATESIVVSAKPPLENTRSAASKICSRRASAYSSRLSAATLGMQLFITDW